MEAYKVAEKVDACMSASTCLSELGTGSDAEFELRNLNVDQLNCLLDDISSMSLKVKKACSKWKKCLVTSGKLDQLKAMLEASSS